MRDTAGRYMQAATVTSPRPRRPQVRKLGLAGLSRSLGCPGATGKTRFFFRPLARPEQLLSPLSSDEEDQPKCQ